MSGRSSHWTWLLVACCGTLALSGCGTSKPFFDYWHDVKAAYEPPPPHQPLGAVVDETFATQEANAEASDFVVYQHEFEYNGARLNGAGMDHVKEIASRLYCGQNFPVVVERSDTSVKEGTEYEFPVHPNPELDLKRREVVVASLAAMGVPHAEERVVVAPAFAKGVTAPEAASAYQQAISQPQQGGYGGFGGGFGGFGFGGFGGVGLGGFGF